MITKGLENPEDKDKRFKRAYKFEGKVWQLDVLLRIEVTDNTSDRIVRFVYLDGDKSVLIHHAAGEVTYATIRAANRKLSDYLKPSKIETANMSFAEKLKAHRVARRLNKTDVANNIGVSYRVYDRWESGQCMPGADNFLHILNCFKIKINF